MLAAEVGSGREDPALGGYEVAALGRADAYPHDPSAALALEQIQTHLSHVFLTGRRVYKFRKSVDLGFVCFTSRAERNSDCLREVTLNRRLAPDVYLGVAPLERGERGVRIGAVSSGLASHAAEHCVVMRRLPDGRDALSLLEAGKLRGAHVDRIARAIARFHALAGLGTPAPLSKAEWLRRCAGPVADNLRLLAESPADVAPRDTLGSVVALARRFEAEHANRFERRRLEGRAVEGHGDLHLQHVWLESDDAEPLAIDCLEFSEQLRCIDAASEVAFFAMDLRYRGAPDLAARFLRVYASERDDFDLYRVVDYFMSYRAAVRAKVAAIAAGEVEIDVGQRERAAESARAHLELAETALAPRETGLVVLVGGSVGTGKSTAAKALADGLQGVVISSDRVRKHLLRIAPTERADASSYTPAQKARVYAELLPRAAAVIDSGRTAILDATWGRRQDREMVLRWARDRGVRAFFVEARCAGEVARERLRRRAAAADDASDADASLQRASASAFEPATEWPREARAAVATDEPDWGRRLLDVARRLFDPFPGAQAPVANCAP
jgi:aminoglycoside phosphotransferase family enzyme/predicted kinase